MMSKQTCKKSMSGNRECVYWKKNKDWYRINWEKDCYELTDKAPERAIKSFELYLNRHGKYR